MAIPIPNLGIIIPKDYLATITEVKLDGYDLCIDVVVGEDNKTYLIVRGDVYTKVKLNTRLESVEGCEVKEENDHEVLYIYGKESGGSNVTIKYKLEEEIENE